ncbi:conjugal transfer protein TrbI [Acidithiobacillus ferrooxidans]|uniref:TrbI/VirB10 family protein n=1 Tax=Acidithiobacillus ferrooxidans TaxID=920 RepID=UPI001C06CB27|nr:TrbI/VirB10 family protein [Acidithiobacillus ferrooxidans]MBU2774438.1 conjugal transfer protein TrbI [Acidithiobacillus ferrooxidans]
MADNQTPMGEGPARKVRGPIIPDKKTLGAHLKSGKIVAYAVLGAVVVGGVGFVAIDKLHGFGAPSGPTEEKVHSAPQIMPGKKQPNLAAPGARMTTGTAPTRSMVSAQPASTTAPTVSQPSPQDTAFEQAISGQGGHGGPVVSWGGGNALSPTVAATQSTSGTPADALTLAKSIALMTHKNKEHGIYSSHLDRREVSPYELLQGTVIPAILETGIKSDLAGQVTAVVAHPVYNSLNASSVLIPAGSKLIGYYRSGAAMGQTRVGVEWTRVEFPDGTYIRLSNMPGTSPRGYAGFKDLVDNHTWEIFKNALLLSFIDVGMAMASPTSTATNTTGVTGNEALQNGEQALAQTFGQAEAQLFQKYINIAPTLTIRPGYAFNVVVTNDLVFPGPYRHGVNLVGTGLDQMVSSSAPAMPSEANPYGGN